MIFYYSIFIFAMQNGLGYSSLKTIFPKFPLFPHHCIWPPVYMFPKVLEESFAGEAPSITRTVVDLHT